MKVAWYSVYNYVQIIVIITFIFYLDDEPDPGPNSYIIITGFNDTEVLSQLTQVGVAVHVLVKVTSSSNIDVDSEGNRVHFNFHAHLRVKCSATMSIVRAYSLNNA